MQENDSCAGGGGNVTLAMSTDPRFAEPTPFARLVYAHAVSVAGDACLTVSLAGWS